MTPDSQPVVIRATRVCRTAVLVAALVAALVWLLVGSYFVSIVVSSLCLLTALLCLIHRRDVITFSSQNIAFRRLRDLSSGRSLGPLEVPWETVRRVELHPRFLCPQMYVITRQRVYKANLGYYMFTGRRCKNLQKDIADHTRRALILVKPTVSELVVRFVVLLCGILFAIPTYLIWHGVIVSHQWPADANGYLGLIVPLLLSSAAFFYFFFYPTASRIDSRLAADMQIVNRRGRLIYSILFSVIILLALLPFFDAFIIQARPMALKDHLILIALMLVWVAVMLVINTDIVQYLLPGSLRKKFSRLLYRSIVPSEYQSTRSEEEFVARHSASHAKKQRKNRRK